MNRRKKSARIICLLFWFFTHHSKHFSFRNIFEYEAYRIRAYLFFANTLEKLYFLIFSWRKREVTTPWHAENQINNSLKNLALLFWYLRSSRDFVSLLLIRIFLFDYKIIFFCLFTCWLARLGDKNIQPVLFESSYTLKVPPQRRW